MRVLATCSLGGAGHLRPMLPLLTAAVARGDEVVLLAPPGLHALAEEAGLAPLPLPEPPEAVVAPIRAQLAVLPAPEAARLGDGELFGRLATGAALPAVERAADRLRPHLILREPCEHAGAVVARATSTPLATVAISLAATEWSVVGMTEAVVDAHGAGASALVRASPYVSAFPAALDPSPFPATVRVRPEPTAPAPLPDWWPGDTRPLAYLTMGTVLGHMDIAADVLRTVVDAVAALPVRVLLSTGRAVDPASLGPLPPRVHAERWVSQVDALAAASLVVCHGGSGTTFAALAAGRPVVVVPVFADQFANGRLVAGAGAGRCVERPADPGGHRRPPGPDMREAITGAVGATLRDAGAAAAAGAIAEEMGRAGGPGEVIAGLDPTAGVGEAQSP